MAPLLAVVLVVTTCGSRSRSQVPFFVGELLALRGIIEIVVGRNRGDVLSRGSEHEK
jgi:hypothetical protein